MEMTIYRHETDKHFYPVVELDNNDFDLSVSESDIEEMVDDAKGSGRVFSRSIAFLHLKPHVIREMIEKIGSVEQAALFMGLDLDHYYLERFKKAVEVGDFERAAKSPVMSSGRTRTISIRRDAKESTIRKKVSEAMDDLSSDLEERKNTLPERYIEELQGRVQHRRSEYQSYVVRQINDNGEFFENANASEIAELRERIAGYRAMIKEAEGKIRSLKNAQVVQFAENDGELGENSPIAPETLENIKTKAGDMEFFPASSFRLRT